MRFAPPSLWLLLLLGLGVSGMAAAEVPAYFLFGITPPAGVSPLAGPEAICFDRRHQELYVADAGNSRILIFDHSGSYLFEFSDPERLSSPRAIDVDSAGHIYVLTARPANRLHIFDYDGTFVRDLPMGRGPADSTLNAESFVIGSEGRIYAVDGDSGTVYVYGADGDPEFHFSLLDSTNKSEDDLIFGRAAWIHDRFVIPLPVYGQVAIYTADGRHERTFGIAGATPGSFSFPIAACEDKNGGLVVLDKHRFTVMQFRMDGHWVTELGGMGISPGWFYHPQALCTDGEGRYFVAQTFMNRVQAVRIPGESPLATEVRVSVVDAAANAGPDRTSTP